MLERTLVLIKPDGVAKGLIGEIISRFERRGFNICAMKLIKISRDKAELHYEEHRSKQFFARLVEFIISGPLVAMVIEGPGAIKNVRHMMGPTDPAEALPGTIRGDYALNISRNIVHGSDSLESANREIANFFKSDEIIE
ncbi:MAG: Nucleoside diphosphate kinase [Firmicutes bacterium]|nr:Nucleoside diphosphate kinase [Bacillota bacterium]